MRRVLPVLVAITAACSPQLPAISVTGAVPSWGYQGDDTDIVLTGTDFYPGVQAGARSNADVDREFQAWLVAGAETTLDGIERYHSLEGVDLVSYTALDARVPAGLEPGVYSIEVLGPGGEFARATDAFTVTSTRAERLSVSSDSLAYTVGDVALLELALLDPSDQIVASNVDEDPFLVEVTATRVNGETEPELGAIVTFDATLDSQQSLVSLADGVGVRGYLERDGTGTLALTANSAEELLITVGPGDEDAVVERALTIIDFTPGGASTVQISLPEDDFVATAGEAFEAFVQLLDAEGNPTQGAVANVYLLEDCGTWHDAARVVDSATVEVVPTAATGSNTLCDANHLTAQLELGTTWEESQSDDFQVLPGDVAALDVVASPTTLTAGVTEVTVVARVTDAYGNAVDSFDGDLVLEDSEGGLTADGSAGEQSCNAFSGGSAVCSALLWRTGSSVRITADAGDGVTGTSGALEVIADVADHLDATTTATELAAGEDAAVKLQLLDRFDNPLEMDPLGVDVPAFTDEGDDVGCTWIGTTTSDLTENFLCTPTRAEAGKVIDIELPSRGVSTNVGPLDVTNAEVGEIDIDLDGVASVVAGQSLTVALAAFDDYGNPYLEQSSATVNFSDLSGSIVPGSVDLGADGTTSTSVTFTVATNDNQIQTSHLGTAVGASTRFDVEPEAVDQLQIEVDTTYAWLDEDTPVTVTAIDVYGNTVDSYAGSVSVSSDDGLGDEVAVNLSAGVGSGMFVFSTAGLQDTLIVDDGSVSGSSDPLDALDADCADPPSADVRVAATSPTVLCRSSSGSTPSTTVSASSSTAGGSSLVAYHFDLGDKDWTRTSSRSATTTWTEDGAYGVRVVVADADACGDADATSVYVGSTAGEPAGPVDVVVDDDTLTVGGSSSSASTTVSVSAADCSGDPASGGTLYLRAELGALSSSGSSTLVSTGSGLALTLDSAGEGELTWSMASTSYDGQATLHAGVPSGGAYGGVEVTATGDSAKPTVHWVTPSGTTSESFDELVITFSEAMDTDFATASRISLTTPEDGALDLDDDWISFNDDEDIMTVALDTTYDAGEGQWFLALTSGLRDQSGSQLDGGYKGSASAFTLSFGDVSSSEEDVTDCTPSTTVFRPDGDDGSDEDADEVDVSVTASGTPDWWELVVSDEDGAEVRIDRTAAGASSSATVSWDGRNTEGHVVAAGTYTLELTALDESWNHGDVCFVDVQVDHPYPSAGVIE